MDDKQRFKTAAYVMYVDIIAGANSDEHQGKDEIHEIEKHRTASNSRLEDVEVVDVDEEDFLKEINQFDILQFQNSFYECIEELKIQRVIDAENEEKINHLISVRHDNQRAIKEETSKNSSLTEKHSQEIAELRRKQDEKIHQLEAEKKKLTLAADSCEKETKELKDDIRTLQLTRYSLEKRIKEQDQRLQLQGTARASHLAKMKELETLGKEISKQCTGLADQLMRLEVNVKASEKLNEQLSFINEHQTCITDSLKSDLERKTQEILRLRVEMDEKPCLEELKMKELQNKKQALEQRLKEKETTCENLLAQLETARMANQNSLEALARSEQLCERHLASSNHNAELVSSLNATISNLKRELGQLREDLNSKEKEFQKEKEKEMELVEQFQTEEKSLLSELKAQKDENGTLVKANQDLETLNSSWSEKNTEMNETVTALKEKVATFEKMQEDKPKTETKATNTEKESVKANLEPSVEEPQKNELGSNGDTVVNKENKNETHDKGLHEEAMDVDEKRQENSSTDAVGLEGAVAAEQCHNPVLSNENCGGSTVKESLTSSPKMGLEEQSKSETDKQMELGPSQELEHDKGSKAAGGEEACREGSKLSNGSNSLSEIKPEEENMSMGKGVEEHEVKIDERRDRQPEKQENSSLSQNKESPPLANDSIGETVSTIIAPAENPEVDSSKDAQSDSPPGSKKAINQPENQASAVQQDSSMEVQVIKSTLNEQTDQKTSPEKPENLGKSSSPVVLESVDIQEIPLATNSQTLSSKEEGLPTESQKHVNPLGSNEPSCGDQSDKQNTGKTSPNAKSITVNNKPDVKTLKPTDNQDLRKQDTITCTSPKPPSTTLGSVNFTSLLFPKCFVDQLPVSGSKTPSTSSKTAKRNPYLLPGMSLLNAQRRRGLTSCIEPTLTQPSTISLGSIKTELASSAFTSYSLIGTPSFGRTHNVQNSGDNLPSSSKGKEGSQEWPNFAQEFNPGQKTATSSTENSTLNLLKPTLVATATRASPKRSRPDSEPLLFSDEDDNTDIKSDVASQISRIQSFLRSDRLKRPRLSSSASKEPVV